MIKRVLYSTLLSLFLFSCSSGEDSFNDGWKFRLLDSDLFVEEYALSAYDDSDWSDVSLPHSSRVEPLLVNDQWQGLCWYRKSFEVKYDGSKSTYLTLEGAMNISDVWINGTHLTKHYGGFLPVVIDLTDHLVDGLNVIAVQLDNRDSDITGPKPLEILDFNTYGGLYRNARLEVKDKLHITDAVYEQRVASGGIFVTTNSIAAGQAEVGIKTHITNNYSHAKVFVVEQNIYFDGEVVASGRCADVTLDAEKSIEIPMTLTVEDPKSWSDLSPTLYQLETTVICEDKTVDHETTKIGLRTVEFRGDKLYINGGETRLMGVNRHQEYPYIGYALSDNAQWRDAKIIKDAGFNFVRLSHYPPSVAFLDACDYYGLWVLDAIPGWQYFNDTQPFRENAYQTTRDMIRRDRNHACVLAWEASLNETNKPVDFIEKLHSIVKEEYPSGYSAGWVNYGYDIYLEARQHRLNHPESESLTDKPFIVSEYGDWEYYAQNAGFDQNNWANLKQEERTSRQLIEYGEKRMLQQAANIEQAHDDNLTTKAVADAYWVMFDYNRGYADDLEASGVSSIFREQKLVYDFFRSQNSLSPMVKIASYWTPKSSCDVVVYSNCDEVAMYHNGELVARQKPKACSLLAEPPFVFNIDKYVAGELKAVGYTDNIAVSSHIVNTPLDPIKVDLSIDTQGVSVARNDVVFINARIEDVNGSLCVDAEGVVDFRVEGDAQILGDNPIGIRAGVATILLKTGLKGGTVTITASFNGLSSSCVIVP